VVVVDVVGGPVYGVVVVVATQLGVVLCVVGELVGTVPVSALFISRTSG